MQKLVKELEQLVSFKDTTDRGDTVLIVAKEPQMLVYAHVDDIIRDTGRKDEWWHVHLTVLSLPLQKMQWTLRTEQVTGQEIFTMGGEERFIKAVDFSRPGERKKVENAKEKKKTPVLKIVK